MIPASGTATPATRIRLTYRISVGYISGASVLQHAVNSINEYLQNNAMPAFVVAPASSPEFGGGTIRRDYFVTVDMRTDTDLPTRTWGQVFQNVQRIPLGLAGFDARADLTDSTIISRISVTATSAANQQGAAHDAATQAAADQPANQIGKALTGVGIVVAIAAVAVIVWKVKK